MAITTVLFIYAMHRSLFAFEILTMRSINPPCPGIKLSKSLILNARFVADAANPPKGATVLANRAKPMAIN